jgi:hypothetical protein
MASFMKKVLHSGSTKSPHDLVDRAVSCAQRITDTASERQQEELAKYLAMMKVQVKFVSNSPAVPAHACSSAAVWISRLHVLQ